MTYEIQHFSLCFSQTPTMAQQKIISSASKQAKKSSWFIKGNGVKLLNEIETLNTLKNTLGLPHEIFACSSACEEFELTEQQLASSGVQIAGLGTWVSLCMNSFTLDLSCCNLLPTAVAVSASPDRPKELKQQIDLAFAAAAFDLEPKLLLLPPADQCLLDRQGSLAKYLQSASLYGIEQVITGEKAMVELQRILDEHNITLFDPNLHISWGQSFPLSPLVFLPDTE